MQRRILLKLSIPILSLFFVLGSCGLVLGQTAPPELSQQEALKAGIVLMQAGQFDQAIALAMVMLQKNPRDADAYQMLVLSLFEKGDNLSVVYKVLQAEQAGVETAFLYQKQAEAFFKMNAVEACLQSLAKIETLPSHDARTNG
jgi:tetratricopeptide (TPR) repeat protein